MFVVTKVRINGSTNVKQLKQFLHVIRKIDGIFFSLKPVHSACDTIHLLACNFAKFLRILFFTSNSSKYVAKWSLNNPPHFKRVATVPCDVSLITMHVSDCRWFSDINVSGGNVATLVRCARTVGDYFTANLVVNLSVKEFWKSVNIRRCYEQITVVPFSTDRVH